MSEQHGAPPPIPPRIDGNAASSATGADARLPPPLGGLAATARPTPPPRPVSVEALLDLALGLGVFLVFSVLTGAIWGLSQLVHGLQAGTTADLPLRAPGPLAQLLMAMFSLGPTAVLLYWLRRPALSREVVDVRPGIARTLLLAVATGAGLMLANTALLAALEAAGVHAEPDNVAVIQAMASRHPVLIVVFVAVVAPIYEETLFRRVLFARWWAAGRAGVGMALSAAVFSSLHGVPGVGDTPFAAACLLWLVYAAMGVVLAWLYRRTGALWAAIVAHGVNNLLAILVLLSAQTG